MSEQSLLAAVQSAARPGYAELTAAGLRENRPDLVAAIEAAHNISAQLAAARGEGDTAGRLAGAAAERERLAGIDKIMPRGMEKLAAELKADAAITPEKAAVRFLEAHNAIAGQRLQSLGDAEKLVTGITAAPSADVAAAATAAAAGGKKFEQNDAGWKAEYAATPAIAAEFAGEADYVAFKKQEAAGNVRILRGKAAA